MAFVRKWLFLVVAVLGSSAVAAVNVGSVVQQNTEKGFLSYYSLDKINPYEIQLLPEKTLDFVDWDELNQIPDGSLTECSKVSTSSASWKFFQAHKRPETQIVVVSRWNQAYPCRHMAEHLIRHDFSMASLEDVPLSIAQKFTHKHLIFFLENNFYKDHFHNPTKAVNYLKHEEMHLIQALHNPHLEKYMWNAGKTQTTDFGRFIEGCTEFHFRTNGPGYRALANRYGQWLERAVNEDRKIDIDRACSGDYDRYVELREAWGAF